MKIKNNNKKINYTNVPTYIHIYTFPMLGLDCVDESLKEKVSVIEGTWRRFLFSALSALQRVTAKFEFWRKST